MTVRQLGTRMGVAPSRVLRIEQDEVSGVTSLKTLRHAAEAMNCVFVYALVPIESLDDILRDRATQKAQEDILRLDHTMRLENQALLESDLDAERQRVVDRLVTGSLRGLWDEGKERA